VSSNHVGVRTITTGRGRVVARRTTDLPLWRWDLYVDGRRVQVVNTGLSGVELAIRAWLVELFRGRPRGTIP
jgi:hypothetical protein